MCLILQILILAIVAWSIFLATENTMDPLQISNGPKDLLSLTLLIGLS